VGLAAQRSIATLLAGLQLSLTQPVRVGDLVVIEGEWGTIEEITVTYVVVRIWDLRRLVVPITRISRRAVPELDALRIRDPRHRLPPHRLPPARGRGPARAGALRRHAARVGRKGGRPAGHERADRTVEIRALVSSTAASRSWDLRCAVRETGGEEPAPA
jgi:hypothetical protein